MLARFVFGLGGRFVERWHERLVREELQIAEHRQPQIRLQLVFQSRIRIRHLEDTRLNVFDNRLLPALHLSDMRERPGDVRVGVHQARGGIERGEPGTLGQFRQMLAALDKAGADIEIFRQPRDREMAKLLVGFAGGIFGPRILHLGRNRARLAVRFGGLGGFLFYSMGIWGPKLGFQGGYRNYFYCIAASLLYCSNIPRLGWTSLASWEWTHGILHRNGDEVSDDRYTDFRAHFARDARAG